MFKKLILIAFIVPFNCSSASIIDIDNYWLQTGFSLGSPFFGQTFDIKVQNTDVVYSLGVKTQDTSAPCIFNCADLIKNNEITSISSIHALGGYAINNKWFIESGLALVKTKVDYNYIYETAKIGIPIRINKKHTYKYGGWNISLELLILERKVAYSANLALMFGKF